MKLNTNSVHRRTGTNSANNPVISRSQWPHCIMVGLRSLAYWNCGFESHWGYGWLYLVTVESCQVEVSATGRSLTQRSSTDWCV